MLQVCPKVFLKKTLSKALRIRVRSDKIAKSSHRNQDFNDLALVLRFHRFRILIAFASNKSNIQSKTLFEASSEHYSKNQKYRKSSECALSYGGNRIVALQAPWGVRNTAGTNLAAA